MTTRKNTTKAKKATPALAKATVHHLMSGSTLTETMKNTDETLTEKDIAAYEDPAELAKIIASIKKGVSTLDSQLQRVLTGIAVQLCKPNAQPNDGKNLANDLLAAIGAGVVKTRRVIWWLETYAPLKFKNDAKGGVSEFSVTAKLPDMKAEFEKDRIGFVSTRNKRPYSGSEFKAARNAAQAFDFDKALNSLLKKAEKAKEELILTQAGQEAKTFDPANIKLGKYETIKQLLEAAKQPEKAKEAA